MGYSSGGTPCWLESRDGVTRLTDASGRNLAPGVVVRGGVGYGGGDFVADRHGLLVCSRAGELIDFPAAGGPHRTLVPRFGGIASPTPSSDGARVAFVHSCEGDDVVGVVDRDGLRWPRDLVRGADFYMQPAWSPSGDLLAWIEWSHPYMPWDGARLMLGDPAGTGGRVAAVRALSAPGVAAFQPCWSPTGEHLAWIEARSPLHEIRISFRDGGGVRTVHRGPALLPPAWIQGMRTLVWSPDGRELRFIEGMDGRTVLARVGLDGGELRREVGPWGVLAQPLAHPRNDEILLLASSPDHPDAVVRWTPSERFSTVAISMPPPPFPGPLPEHVGWIDPIDGLERHAILWRPRGVGPFPVVVDLHGGPTSQRQLAWQPDAAFLMAQGIAVFQPNYRGSSGYGEEWRRALDGLWGIADTQDALSAARHVVRTGLADPRRLVLRGGSAGGFTVLNTLAEEPGLFRAGVVLFGVVDLEAQAQSTHKFEKHYLNTLVGPLPEAAALYRERSPLRRAASIRDAIAVFQGSEDRVVPPQQAEALVACLRESGTPQLYRCYEGEGHGWRATSTLRSYYADLLGFLRLHLDLP